MPTFVADFAPPAALTGLTVSAETAAAVRLEWDASTLSDLDFVSYNVSRSTTGQPDDFTLLSSITAKATTYFDDFAAPIGVTLYYRVTQSSLDAESAPAEAETLLADCDYWLVTVGAIGDSFAIPNVTDYASEWPLQLTEHEPIGRPYKLVETGALLGEEGVLSATLLPEQAGVIDQLRAAVSGIARELLLKSPWGEVYEVDLGSLRRQRQTGARQVVTFRFIQVG